VIRARVVTGRSEFPGKPREAEVFCISRETKPLSAGRKKQSGEEEREPRPRRVGSSFGTLSETTRVRVATQLYGSFPYTKQRKSSFSGPGEITRGVT